MTTGLLSVCLGCNSTIVAIAKHPEEFTHVRALLGLQPISARPFVEHAVESQGIEHGVELFDDALHLRTGFHVDEQSPIEYAKSVKLPTFIAQVHYDVLTKQSDVQAIYDNIAAADKRRCRAMSSYRRPPPARDSVVNITALVTLTKSCLDDAAGHLPAALMDEVDRARATSRSAYQRSWRRVLRRRCAIDGFHLGD